jgi:hypothetical protein
MLIIAPVIKQLNFKRQSSIKPNAGKGFDDSATKCFRYFATGSIIQRHNGGNLQMKCIKHMLRTLILTVLICCQGCENSGPLRSRIAELEETVSKQAATIEQYKARERQSKERDRQREEGSSATPLGVIYSDQQGAITVEILKILTGDQIIANAKMHSHQLSGIREQGKDLIYFEIKISNNKFDGELSLNQYYFKLESEQGDTFSTEMTRDYIRGKIHQGRSAIGGIAFAIYPNSKPKWLRYDTSLQDRSGTKLEAVSPDLQPI